MLTLNAARDKIAALTTSGELGADGATVYIRGGDYYNPETLTLNSSYSATAAAPITYKAYPGEEVNFYGGVKIDTDELVSADADAKAKLIDQTNTDKLMMIDLGDYISGDIGLPQLRGSYTGYMSSLLNAEHRGNIQPEIMINGQLQTIARYPNNGTMTVASVITDGSNTPFEIKVDDDRVKKWADISNVFLYGKFTNYWSDQTVSISNVNQSTGAITSQYPAYYGDVTLGMPVYAYNLLEEIDAPGEYFIDTTAKKLYIYPPEEEIKDIVLMTRNTSFISMNRASYITIEGINMIGNMCLNSEGKCAVAIYNGTNNTIKNCTIANMQSRAADISGTNNGLDGCVIYNCDIGVQIRNGGGDIDLNSRISLTKSGNFVKNSDLYNNEHISKTYSPAIELKGCGHIVSNNEIHDAEHNLIAFSGNEHVISNNEIYNAVTNTADAGAIYSTLNMTYKGNKITNNYFHDLGRSLDWSNDNIASKNKFRNQAVYFDGLMSSAEVSGNVFYNMERGAYFSGSDNIVKNNIFIDCDTEAVNVNPALYWVLENGVLDASNATNSIVASLEEIGTLSDDGVYTLPDNWIAAYPEMADYLTYVESGGIKFKKPNVGTDIQVYNNVVYNTTTAVTAGTGITFKTNENNIIFESDPGFEDYDNKKFNISNYSEIQKKIPGFKPIMFSLIGIKK